MSTDDRFVVCGLAHVRAEWFRRVARWSTAGVIPLEFLKCLSTEDLRARIDTGQSVSAVLVGGDLPGVDRALIARALERGAAVIIVAPRSAGRDWSALGAATVLEPDFDQAALLRVLHHHARPVLDPQATPQPPRPASGRAARLVAVMGPGGTGASTAAMALAQGLATRKSAPAVLLADFCRQADLCLYHDRPDNHPGLPELIDAHRHGTLAGHELKSLVRPVTRGYDLLPGLRRAGDWTAVAAPAIAPALATLRRHYDVVVVDMDPDLEDAQSCGSVDVEERHALTRETTVRLDVVVLVGSPGVKGLHSLARLVQDVIDWGVPAARLIPIVNRIDHQSATTTRRSLATVMARSGRAHRELGPVATLRRQRRLETRHRDVGPLPTALTRPLAGAVTRALDSAGPRPAVAEPETAPPATVAVASPR